MLTSRRHLPLLSPDSFHESCEVSKRQNRASINAFNMSAPLRRFRIDIPGVGLRRKNTKKDYCWGKMKKNIVPLPTYVTNEESAIHTSSLREPKKNIRAIREIRGE